MKWFSLMLVGCASPVLPPRVTGWVGDSTQVDVAGPIRLRCNPTCTGGAQATATSAAGDVAVSFVASNGQWIGTPKVRFAYGRQYSLDFPPAVETPILDFKTVADPSVPPTVTTWPDPGATLPNNADWIVLHFSPAVARQGVLDLVLVDRDVQVQPKWIDADGGGLVDEAILWGPFGDSRCSVEQLDQLCPGESYVLRSLSGLFAPGSSFLSDVATYVAGDALDGAPSWLDDGNLQANDIALRLQRGVDRPCLLQPFDFRVADSGPAFPNDFTGGTAVIAGFTPAAEYAWSIVCVDAAGGATPGWSFSFQTTPAAVVHLVELVPQPLQDWNDSSGAVGAPFDDQPGPVAHATSNDEYAELSNDGEVSVDISAWHLVVTDEDTSDETLGNLWEEKPIHAFGSLPLLAGARVVVSMSPSGKNATASATVELHDDFGLTRDAVSLGQNGVPLGNGVDLDHESVSLCLDGWRQTRATPGDANDCP